MTQTSTAAKRSVSQWRATTEILLPSGLTVTARRPPLALWFAEGRVPENLFNSAMNSAQQSGAMAVQTENLDTKELFAFALEVAKAALVWPRVVENANSESDDEIAPEFIPYLDVMHIMSWALEGSPGVPVNTTSGEVSVESLGSFRADEHVQSDSGGGGEVSQNPGGVDGNS